MPKTKKKQFNHKQPILYGIIAGLTVACVVLAIALVHSGRQATAQKGSPSVSLGAMQYRFTAGKAIKRNDASVNVLKSFLDNEAAHSGCSATAPAYEHVVAYTKDETQIFLGYGCGAADSPMFAVKTNGIWRSLSPTNHFDSFGLPDCQYVTANNISNEIAPVCASDTQLGVPTGIPKYLVR